MTIMTEDEEDLKAIAGTIADRPKLQALCVGGYCPESKRPDAMDLEPGTMILTSTSDYPVDCLYSLAEAFGSRVREFEIVDSRWPWDDDDEELAVESMD